MIIKTSTEMMFHHLLVSTLEFYMALDEHRYRDADITVDLVTTSNTDVVTYVNFQADSYVSVCIKLVNNVIEVRAGDGAYVGLDDSESGARSEWGYSYIPSIDLIEYGPLLLNFDVRHVDRVAMMILNMYTDEHLDLEKTGHIGDIPTAVNECVMVVRWNTLTTEMWMDSKHSDLEIRCREDFENHPVVKSIATTEYFKEYAIRDRVTEEHWPIQLVRIGVPPGSIALLLGSITIPTGQDVTGADAADFLGLKLI